MRIKIKFHFGLWLLLNFVNVIKGEVDFIPLESTKSVQNLQLTKYRYDMLNKLKDTGRFAVNKFDSPVTFYYDYRPYSQDQKNQYYLVTNDKQVKQTGNKYLVKTAKSTSNLKTSIRNKDVVMKMKALESVLDDDENGSRESETLHSLHEEIKLSPYMTNETKRIARQVRKQRPGLFWTLIRVTFETISDTRRAIQQIARYINESISPDNKKKPSTSNTLKVQPKIEDNNSTTTSNPETTTQGPVITRSGLVNILARNIRGLIRLFNIEWSDAWKQSQKTVSEFRNNLGKQVFKYLQDNPDFY